MASETVVIEAEEHAFTEACLESALRVLKGASDVAAEFDRLADLECEICYAMASTKVLAAARARGVPVYRLDDGSRMQLGEGRLQQRVAKGVTSRTGHIAEQIATNKAYVKTLWARVGVPIADGQAVNDAPEAVAVAERVGWPVVIKPADSDWGLGVSMRLADADQVQAAYRRAREYSESVLVERHLEGAWHRLLIIDDRLVAALRRDPATVTGDGTSAIARLVERANEDERRGPDSRWPLRLMELGDLEREYLGRMGMGPETVLEAGRQVVLRPIAHTDSGSISTEVSDLVHPSTVHLARDAVKVVGLDIAGLDVIAQDISRPLAEQGGGFLEINPYPALFLHLEPICDRPRPVGEAIVASLFPGTSNGRVPLFVVMGEDPARALVAPLADSLREQGVQVATSTAFETFLGDQRLRPTGPTPADRLAAMMFHPRTEAAVLALSPAEFFAHGLGTDQCAVLLMVGPFESQHLAALAHLPGSARRVVVASDDHFWDETLDPARVVRADDWVVGALKGLDRDCSSPKTS